MEWLVLSEVFPRNHLSHLESSHKRIGKSIKKGPSTSSFAREGPGEWFVPRARSGALSGFIVVAESEDFKSGLVAVPLEKDEIVIITPDQDVITLRELLDGFGEVIKVLNQIEQF